MTKHEHLAAYVECKAAVPGSADSILILFTHEQRDTIVSALRALSPPEPTEGLREALTLAEDVLSRAPFSTQIWPNGMHPNEGIALIRAALRAMPLQDHAVTQDKRHD